MMKAHATAARRSHQLVKDPCCTCHAYKAQNRQSELVFRNAKQVKLWGRIWRNYGHHELRRYLPLGSNEDGNRKVPGVLECWQDLTKVVTEHYRNVLVYTKWFHVHFYYFKTNQKKSFKKTRKRGTSLVAQWMRICLPMQGTQVQSLIQEDSTSHRATKPVSHNYWARVRRARAPHKRGRWSEKPTLRLLWTNN